MEIYDGNGELSSGKVLTTNDTGEMSWQIPKIQLNEKLEEILDIIIDKAGLDIKADTLYNMGDEELKQLLRNLKIDSL